MNCDNIICKQLTFKGIFNNFTNIIRKNKITIKRKNILYSVSINTVACIKDIKINTQTGVSFDLLFSLLCELLHFENLFDGIFFAPTSITADSVEYIDKIQQELISFYSGQERYTSFNLINDDKTYMRYFVRWSKLRAKIKLIHQVYLYSAFINVYPVDVRFSLLLEMFEPLADILKSKGKITFASPTFSPTICPKCNLVVKKGKKNEPSFNEKLNAITNIYRKTFFKGEYKKEVLRQAVNLRNRVLHVDANKKKYLNGKRCGVYFFKFALMYRCIIFSLLGFSEHEYMPIAERWLKEFNTRYGDYLIKS